MSPCLHSRQVQLPELQTRQRPCQSLHRVPIAATVAPRDLGSGVPRHRSLMVLWDARSPRKVLGDVSQQLLHSDLECVTLMLHSPDPDPLETRMNIGFRAADHGVRARHLIFSLKHEAQTVALTATVPWSYPVIARNTARSRP